MRISTSPDLRPLLESAGTIGRLAAARLGVSVQPVRALLFDKSPARNWALGWHQDRTICVRDRHDESGFGPWTVKDGLHHVEPPFALLERMVTIRVHLDDVPAGNAPLLVAPGSHRLGRLRADEIATAVGRCGSFACTARAGDVWLYATPILHASGRAMEPARRRVLQIDYSADALPIGLEWTGIDIN